MRGRSLRAHFLSRLAPRKSPGTPKRKKTRHFRPRTTKVLSFYTLAGARKSMSRSLRRTVTYSEIQERLGSGLFCLYPVSHPKPLFVFASNTSGHYSYSLRITLPDIRRITNLDEVGQNLAPFLITVSPLGISLRVSGIKCSP